MSKIISETFYGSREPEWLVESPKEPQTHFDCRGCVRQIRSSSGFRNDSYVRTPGRDYARTSMVNADHRQANYVYNGAPATHRTVIDPPAFTTLSNATHVSNIPIVEFMVPLCCGKCEEKVKEELENVEGVYTVVCDQHNQRVTVSSTLEPQRLLKRVQRIKKNSHFWSSYHVPSQHQIRPYVSPRSSYDPAETQYYMKRKAQVVDPALYYAGAENQYKMSPSGSPFRAGTPYMESSLNYGRLSSPYGGPAYEDYLEYY